MKRIKQKHGGLIVQAEKGETANPNGRPPKMETVLKKLFLSEYSFKLSNSQANEIITSMLSRTRNELLELAKNEDLPFWVSMIVKKAHKDYNSSSIELIEKLFDRVYGKPKQVMDIDHTTKGEQITGLIVK